MCQPVPLKRHLPALALCLLPLAALPSAAADLVLVLDASGSMWGQVEGENKIVIARRVLGELVDGLPDGQEVALVAYGHRREGDCADIETIVPPAPLDRAALKARIEALNPRGKTPITSSLEQALGLVRERRGGATLVLVSDGIETCGGDPCALMREARAAGAEVVLHVIGFDVAEEDISQLECAAQAGGGHFLAAANAGELAGALEAAVALPVDVPAGRLSVKATAGGKLQDVSIRITRTGGGEEAGGGRTYADPSTNPRLIPLADGRYDVRIQAVGLEGDVQRSFDGIEIAGGETVVKEVDFSSGELVVGATRNGELSDATVSVLLADTATQVAGGRTYRVSASNPKTMRLTAGAYDVVLKSVEIAGAEVHRFERLVVEPRGRTEVSHDFSSGELVVGVVRGGQRVDATVGVVAAGGKQVAGGRTYTTADTNPRTFVLAPGDYLLEIGEIRGERREVRVNVPRGGRVEQVVDLARE